MRVGLAALAGVVAVAWGALPASAESPPPLAGHEPLAQAKGDLNGDGLPDWAVAYRRRPDAGARPLLIHWGQAGGGWATPPLRAEGALLRADEGGVLGDPFAGLVVERGTLLVRHQGGAGWGWTQADRYAWDGRTMRLIGSTEEAFHRGAPASTRDHEDANLNTRLVAWSRRDEGQAPAQGLFYELWAPSGAWGPPTRVLSSDFVREGRAFWKGPQDASLSLEANWEGGLLRWRAKVQDDALQPGDRLEWVGPKGQVLATARPGVGGGLAGSLPLAPLGLAEAQAEHRALSAEERALSHPLLKLSWRLVDEDPGEGRVVLASHSHEGHGGILRLGCRERPSLSAMRRSEFRWRSGDELLGER